MGPGTIGVKQLRRHLVQPPSKMASSPTEEKDPIETQEVATVPKDRLLCVFIHGFVTMNPPPSGSTHDDLLNTDSRGRIPHLAVGPVFQIT